MGASSSSTTGKNRRKVSRVSAEEGQVEDPSQRASRLLMQNGQLGNAGEWHKKAHSMYELQRERSMEANSVGLEETEKEHGQPQEERSPIKFSPRKKTTAKENNAKESPKASKKEMNATGALVQDEHCPLAGQSSPGAEGGQSSASSSAATAKPTQRRRPLTWAWLRGHEVSLPATGDQQQTDTKTAAAAGRRRSLKVGNESSLCVHANSDWGVGGVQRQLSSSSANSASSTSAPAPTIGHNSLARRASQGRPLLSQVGRQKSIRKSDAGLLPSLHNPISANGREIVQFCFDQPHNEIGLRICSRLLEKRPDFRNFVYTMGKERWLQMTARLKEFLETVVRRVDNIDIVERVARKYGEEHVELKCFGFKPDFWVSLADAITVECVILDQATHQPSDTITAWSLLVSIMFSAVRDGYYQAMRAQRISQRHKNVHQREMALRVESPGPLGIGIGGGGVEKSQSANELSPGKKNSGGGCTFKYANELTVTAEEGGGGGGNGRGGGTKNGEKSGDNQNKKQSPKKVDFY